MKLYAYLPFQKESGAVSLRINPYCRLAVIFFALASVCWLSVAAYSTRSDAIFESPGEPALPEGNVVHLPQLHAQMMLDTRPGIRINQEAYNKLREKDIAEASRKLLSLAIDLRSELQRTPGALSPAALMKAKQIEKLAHEVKEKMKLNPPIGPM